MKTKQTKLARCVLVAILSLVFVGNPITMSQENPQFNVGATLLAETTTGTAISSVPYTISTSGSYYLTKELQTTSGSQNGITVNADNVTIDLMGFSLIGTGSGNGCGIFMNGRKNVEIKNGTVRNFGGIGIMEAKYYTAESPTYGNGHRIIGVRIMSNVGDGILLNGENHIVKDCTSISNTVSGIAVGTGCTLTNNISSDNGDYSLLVGNGCLLYNNTCNNNYGGIYIVGNGNCIKMNTIRNIYASCIYVAGTNNAIEENLLTNAHYGIYFSGTGNFYANNRASGNTTNYYNTTGQTNGGGNSSF